MIDFDLSRTTFLDPFGVTLLAGIMRECAERGARVGYIEPFARKPSQFLKSVGFEDIGERPRGVVGFVGRQVELRLLNAVDPSYTDDVLSVLRGYIHMSEGVRNALHLSLNELMTNTFDHSKSLRGCLACSQAYTERGEIDISITDFGIGILKALSSVEKYSHLANSIDAIELAVHEGVSSRSESAGLGLAHIQRFLKVNEGQMHIISGDGWVNWNFSNGERVVKKTLNIPYEGTIVDLIARADGEGFYFLKSETEERIF